MKPLFLPLCLLVLSACNKVSQHIEGEGIWDRYCINGVSYITFRTVRGISATVELTPEGMPRTCEEKK